MADLSLLALVETVYSFVAFQNLPCWCLSLWYLCTHTKLNKSSKGLFSKVCSANGLKFKAMSYSAFNSLHLAFLHYLALSHDLAFLRFKVI